MMTTYGDESHAEQAMAATNRARFAAGNDREVVVLVEGSEDGQWTVMELQDAVEAEFTYRWSTR